jgi:protein gp37
MSDKTKIEWTDASWNPVSGCSKVSQGCKNCYALRDWGRLSANPKTVYFGREFTDVMCHPERLDQPLRWKKPRKIFVNSMSDLFHEDVPDSFIDQVFDIMESATHHVFQVLTKRAKRQRDYLIARADSKGAVPAHIWIGISVEDQATANERIPLLMLTPASVRWLSMEPLLGPVDIDLAMYGPEDSPDRHGLSCFGFTDGAGEESFINWVVVGGESGPNARPMHPSWARSLRDQCKTARVPFLFKQWGEWAPTGDEPVKGDLTALVSESAEEGGATNPVRMGRFGKKIAGRLLDTIEHNGYPQAAVEVTSRLEYL